MMDKRLLTLAPFIILTTASGVGAQDPPAAAPQQGAAVRVVTRSATTLTGQPIALPQGAVEVAVSIAEIPVGGALPMHLHPWPRYFYVERGRLRVRYEAAGLTREFGAGEAGVEAVGQWHEARVVGDEPVRVVVFDQVPPGRTNVVNR